MKHSIQIKLENLCERYDEIAALLSEPEVQSNQNRFRALSQEYAQIAPLVDCDKRYDHKRRAPARKRFLRDRGDRDREMHERSAHGRSVQIDNDRRLHRNGGVSSCRGAAG